MTTSRVVFLPLALLLGSCVERYEPVVPAARQSYLVVDGFINAAGGTSIKLSRTLGLGQTGPAPVEGQARVYVEADGGGQYALAETAAGTYTLAARVLDAGQRYRLHLYTKGGQEYASAFTAVKRTPPIDSVTWRAEARGLSVRVNTHDPGGQSRYYRWTFDETWEFVTGIFSELELINGRLKDRRTPIDRCWASSGGPQLRVGNSVGLSQDRISQQVLTVLPPTSTKLRVKYSVLVRQYAQTKEEYEYWEQLQKNTESIGSIYDAQPSQLTGNVQRVDRPDEPVLGYVGVYSTSEMRLFVDRTQLPRDWYPDDPYRLCLIPDTVLLRDIVSHLTSTKGIPLRFQNDTITHPDKPTILVMTAECADCRVHGTNIRPAYWQ